MNMRVYNQTVELWVYLLLILWVWERMCKWMIDRFRVYETVTPVLVIIILILCYRIVLLC